MLLILGECAGIRREDGQDQGDQESADHEAAEQVRGGAEPVAHGGPEHRAEADDGGGHLVAERESGVADVGREQFGEECSLCGEDRCPYDAEQEDLHREEPAGACRDCQEVRDGKCNHGDKACDVDGSAADKVGDVADDRDRDNHRGAAECQGKKGLVTGIPDVGGRVDEDE